MSNIEFYCPAEGELIRIEDFPDEIIANKDMGDGFGINLTSDNIYAPMDCEIKVMYPTGHAICMETEDGTQVMIHIGTDTYKIQNLNKTYVKVGDKVQVGDLLVKTNAKELKKLTGNSAMAVVFLSGEKIKLLKPNQEVKCLDDSFIEVNKD